MAAPKRRSSRMRGSTPQASVSASPAPLSQLQVLSECEETNEDTVKSPMNTSGTSAQPQTAAQTPSTGRRIIPTSEEMHPVLHHSVKKIQPANRIPVPASPSANFTNSSPNRVSTVPSSSTFDFRHASVELSTEAQKMMDEVRSQAARIKEELRAQEQARSPEETATSYNSQGRKMAKPKGKAGRFSDVHMADFKKMDSIANHASAFRADPARFPPAQKSLKRSKSKAELDKPDITPARESTIKLVTPRTPPAIASVTSAKRIKQLDGSVMIPRPMSDRESCSADPHASPPTKQTPSLMTPTRASLARASSARSLKTDSKIPALARKASIRSIATPTKVSRAITSNASVAVVQSENSHKFRNAMASKLSNVKSILRRPQIRFSDDPAKIAAGTHLATPKTSGKDKPLPQLPDAPDTPSHRAEKHVNFSASTSTAPFERPLPEATTPTPARKSAFSSMIMQAPAIQYPSLSAGQLPPSPSPVSHFAKAKPRAGPTTGPGDFTFRSNHVISFSSPTKTPKPATTIRQVRTSNNFRDTQMSVSGLSDLPNIAHGLSNKKRKRDTVTVGDEETSDKENLGSTDGEVLDQQSPSKRPRMMSMSAQKKPQSKPLAGKMAMSSPLKPLSSPAKLSAFQKGKAKGAITMSRLNALARPKERK